VHGTADDAKRRPQFVRQGRQEVVLAAAVALGARTSARSCELIGRQVSHISHLVDDLLDVERVVNGKVRLRRRPLDLAENVRHIVATFVEAAGKDRIIEVNIEPVWVDCDAVRIDQVLINLMTNAVKYTPSGGLIVVTLKPDGAEAVLKVEDTGFGISPRLLPFIFDMYAQADRTLDRAQGGLGIGLTLARRLVELHGGTVTAASEGEGRGSTFTVRLKQVPSVDQSSSDPEPRERRVRPRRVLLIEDSADAREMLRMMLELAGHIVYDAADGVRGLELLNVVRPDVGIIDIGLPVMDGYEVAKRIRGEPHGRRMLLLALTGYDAPQGTTRSTEHGFDYHLVKPVDPERLARLITRGVAAA
jgi:CheY-like chemotaxis protein